MHYTIHTTGHKTYSHSPYSVTVFFFSKTSDSCSGKQYKISVSTFVIGLGSGSGGGDEFLRG